MIYTVIKFAISAALIVGISEISKRSSFLGGLLGSLPFVSLLAFVWLYRDTHDTAKVAVLSTSIFWLVLPSLALFIVLPVLLKRGVAFYPALGMAVVVMLACYGGMVLVLGNLGIKL